MCRLSVFVFRMKAGKDSERGSLWEELGKYGRLRIDYVRLLCVEKLAVLLSGIAVSAIVAILVVAALFYLAAALQAYVAYFIGATLSYLVVAGVFILLVGLVFLMKKSLIVNPIARFVSKLLIDKRE